MEKFLLRLNLAGDELNVVNEEEVRGAVLAAEFDVFTRLDGADELVGKLVALYVYYIIIGVRALDLVADGISRCVLPRPEPP
jgi:hypothetical protein